ncbi:MAG: TIM barrel protein [Anaerolineales bacterium]
MRVANAPVSWGVLEFSLGKGGPSYDSVLDEIRGAGYAGTELGDWGFLPEDPQTLRRELEKRSMTLVGGFVPVALSDREAHESGERIALRTARLMAGAAGSAPWLILSDDNGRSEVRAQNAGRIHPAHGLSDLQWEVLAGGADRIAQAVLQQSGLRTAFHHHCGGYVETPEEVDRLLGLTDPELVGLCLDTGHYRFGGGDPAEAVRRHAHRIRHVHFKDCHPKVAERSRAEGWGYFESVSRGVFCELGHGEVDFPAVLDALQRVGYAGWIVVEQDVLPGMGTPKESAERNRAYLRSIGI